MDFGKDLDGLNGAKKKKTRNKLQKQNDYTVITELYLKGTSQSQIAKRLGISQTQVSKDLDKIREAWMAESVQLIDQVKAEQLKKIDRIEQEAWDSWEKSKRIKKVTIQRVGIYKNSSTGKGQFETHSEEELGDPRYMSMIQWCITERLKITGGYAPKKIAETDPTGTKEAGQASREEILGWLDNMAARLVSDAQKQPQNLGDYVDAIETIEEPPEDANVVAQRMITDGLDKISSSVEDKDLEQDYDRLQSADQLTIVGNNTVPDTDRSISSTGTAQETPRNPSDLRTAREMTGIVEGSDPETYINLLKRKNLK